jgi:hypothetical protein
MKKSPRQPRLSEEHFVATSPQSVHSKLCTARSRRVGCGATVMSFIGLRPFGQVSFTNMSKDIVGFHKGRFSPNAIRLESKGVSGISVRSEFAGLAGFLRGGELNARLWHGKTSSLAGVPSCTGWVSGSEALLHMQSRSAAASPARGIGHNHPF